MPGSGPVRLRERELEKSTSQKRAEARHGTVKRSAETHEIDRATRGETVPSSGARSPPGPSASRMPRVTGRPRVRLG